MSRDETGAWVAVIFCDVLMNMGINEELVV